MIKVNEIFKSLQGESSYMGLPCVFVRLTGCNLRCDWCDTQYAYDEGTEYTAEALISIIEKFNVKLVEFTGGEPLLQKNKLIPIMEHLLSKDYKILLETNGSILVKDIPEEVVKIIDIKLKGSGEGGTFLAKNLNLIRKKDEIKFVLSSIFDYNEMKDIIIKNHLEESKSILVSRVFGSEITDEQIAEKLLKDGLTVRYQIQLHKLIWGDKKGK
ncbi:MAG: 4Fe-4S cluster-binding domain-containing protein [Candidatus Delongbacteria bacterium]|nr:4Fe-4S cluster-binding domain-containing protein [Candidatus Delongbacteria bacterium]